MKHYLLAAAIFLSPPFLASSCAADFTTPIVGLDGRGFTGPDGKPQDLTLGQVAENALTAAYPDEQTLSGVDKVKRFALALKIHDHPDSTLSAEETTLLKTLIGKAYSTVIVGRAWTLLDPGSVPK